MMLSTQSYYECILCPMSQKELFAEIRSLKRSIRHLRKSLEEQPYIQDEVLPARMTRLSCEREYLEKAIQAYEEKGGIYHRTGEEQRIRDFDASLQFLRKLEFRIGGYIKGFLTAEYTVSGENVDLDAVHEMKAQEVHAAAVCRREEFISELQALHLGEWKRKCDDQSIMDGTQWSLKICYNNGKRPVTFSGSNCWPYSFADLTDYLEALQPSQDT